MLKEYILIVRNFLKAIFETVPSQWQNGSKGDVILIPGFFENFVFLQKIGNRLNMEGYKIWVLKNLTSTESVKSSANKLAGLIAQNKLTNIVLVAHSRGGIIAKYLVDNDQNMANVVNNIITISTPWKGTLFGYVAIANLLEIKPNSKILKALNQNKKHLSKIINIYPRVDNHVIPNKNLVLKGATNHQIQIVGHTTILECAATIDLIVNYCK